MYKLPVDILRKLKNKFPEIQNIEELVNMLFEEIREKSINDGACLIHKFGTFYTYKAYSGKKETFIPRFKFKISRSFSKKIEDDTYVINRIEKVLERFFINSKTENEKYIKNRSLNNQLQSEILNNQTKIKEKTKENISNDEIADILNEDF